MKILLLDLPAHRVVNESSLKQVMENFGVLPSISLLYVAAVLEKSGCDVSYFSLNDGSISRAELIPKIKYISPNLIGCTLYTSPYHGNIEWIRWLKNNFNCKIMVGGVHVGIFPEETILYNKEIDYGIVGEGEVVFPRFIDALNNDRDLKEVKGLVYRNGKGEVIFNGYPELLKNIDEAPFPARHLVDNSKFYNFISERKNYTVFNSSRGCPFGCIFCEAARTKWRARSPKNIVDEFEECYEIFNIREIDIFDSSFTIDKKRVIEICDEIKRRSLHKHVIWDIRSRVDTIDEEMLENLRDAGCYRIFYGIESGNPDILKTLAKGADIERMKHIIGYTKKIGISTFGYFLVGSPCEDMRTYRDTLDFSLKLPLDFCIFNIVTAYPRTKLYEEYYLKKTGRDFWKEYIKRDESSIDAIERPWTDLSREQLIRMAWEAMVKFYFRPIQYLRILRTIKSFEQVKRYMRAAIDMTLNK